MELFYRQALQKSFLFQDMTDKEYTSLIKCLSPQTKHFPRNDIMLLTGDSVQRIGIILAGTACAYLENMDGSQTLISNLTPMSVFGEVLMSTRTHKSPITIHATSDVMVAFIEYQQIHYMCTAACAAHRIFLQNMLKTIGDKYFYLFDRISILREKKLRARIMAYLYILSDRGKNAVVTIPFTKTILADYLLVHRSALSKELRKMENDGIICVKGREIKILKQQ